jgi:hypothetical protein
MFSLLPGCTTESWGFESPEIECARSWCPARREAADLDRLVQSVQRRKTEATASATASASGSTATIAHHVMSACDPVDAIAGGTNWKAERALREFAARTMSIHSAQLSKVVSGADPFTEEGAGAYSDVCAGLGVGLVLCRGNAPVKVIKICPEKNVWLEKSADGWSPAAFARHPIGKEATEALIRARCRTAAQNPSLGIKQLRELAEQAGIEKPYPRSKAGIAELLLK